MDSGWRALPHPRSTSRRWSVWIVALAIPIFFAGCGAILKQDKKGKPATSTLFSISKKGGGYYLDDGPGDDPPADLASIPDAVPRDEPLRLVNMRPYSALGRWYKPMTTLGPYRMRGTASWYGRRYHGQKTASGEVYDMYGMTAAHTTLPIPSYARVTNVANGKSVVVRVNDRGPFLSDRLIDLSYTAAYKLDVLGNGSARVEVESILPRTAARGMHLAKSPHVSRAIPASTPTSDNISAPVISSKSSSSIAQEQFVPILAGAKAPSRESKPDVIEAAYQPAESGTSTSPASDTPAPKSTGDVYLQLGAFGAYDNADDFLARIRAEVPSLTSNLEIVAKDGLFKVHAGPYRDMTLARRAANKIAENLPIKPLLLRQQVKE
ncbi:MAG TPA: septal ring lytic transglycosylase RlpA family protein [Nitrosospira sp.]|nr:septal ring lytic transglycosylase RlpA family protein [Nitrosospira sp.]